MFDSVLIVAFGGPQGPTDVKPFLENVLRGRPVPPQRVEEVAQHYMLFGGVSPITALTERQAEGLRARLAAAGHPLPVYVGMRNWHPFLGDTLHEMYGKGHRRALGFIAAAHHSYSSCGQYRDNVIAARDGLQRDTEGDIAVNYVFSWFDHPLFIDVHVQHLREARAKLPPALRDRARLVFTAHSIPSRMAEQSRYREQLMTSARLVAEKLDVAEWALVYQSRSGRPQDPWLEPDICDYLRAEGEKGVEAVLICPLGFVCDHVEVLYDLDREAADVCRQVGIAMARSEAPNDDPLFVEMMADVVLKAVRMRLLPFATP